MIHWEEIAHLAQCAGFDPELWFPIKGGDGCGNGETAKAICRRCPIKGPCLDQALRRKERFGIWGGINLATPRNVRRARSKRGVAA